MAWCFVEYSEVCCSVYSLVHKVAVYCCIHDGVECYGVQCSAVLITCHIYNGQCIIYDTLATGWKVQGLNPSGGEIFRTSPDRPWGPPSLLYNGYWVSFLRVKRLGCGIDHPPPSSAKVKERVELYLSSPSGPSWPVLGWTLPLPLPVTYSME